MLVGIVNFVIKQCHNRVAVIGREEAKGGGGVQWE